MAKSKSKSSKNNNKKGPKGKKAREKAKLDRQWGEVQVVDDETATPKSRLLGNTNHRRYSRLSSREDQQHEQLHVPVAAPAQQLDEVSIQQDRSNGAESSDEEENEQAFVSLLKSIRKQSRRKRKKADQCEDEDDDGSSSSSSSTDDDEDIRSNNKNAAAPRHDDDAEEEEVEHHKKLGYDPFTERFTRAPLSEKDGERQAFFNQLQQTETVASSDPSLVLQISKVLLDKLQLATNDNADAGARSIESQCRSCVRSFFQCNREVLQRAWREQQRNRHTTTRLLDARQTLIYPFLASYADLLLLTDSSQPARQSTNILLALHILNHVWTSQGRIARHNHNHHQQQQKQQKQHHRNRRHVDREEESSLHQEEEEEPARDQGFTRPTVLILLPTRGCCYKLVHMLLSLLSSSLPPSSSLSSSSKSPAAPADNVDRFEAEFGPPPQEMTFNNNNSNNKDGEQQENPNNHKKQQEQQRRRRQILRQKGAEWLELFGDDVNDDDDFKLGISIHHPKGGSVAATTHSRIKLFSDFYKSDIILASPLGLKMMDESKKERGSDFLSSIEICYLSRADVLLMQNWDHMIDVIRVINKQPQSSTEIDFSRVRPYHLLEGQSQHWRQLIITSSFCDPMILSFFKRYAKSLSGQVRMRRKTLDCDANIAKVVFPTRQVFQRVASKSLAEHASDRAKYFCDSVLPEITRNKQTHTVVFIPSYFDFVTVRNVLLQREIDFVSVTEYSRVSEVSRGRARFLQGRKPILLYTGRAHFFHRHSIKGVRHLIFLGLPEYAEFYSGLVNSINEGLEEEQQSSSTSSASCLALFTKYDGYALERLVGSSNCSRMIKGDKPTFMF